MLAANTILQNRYRIIRELGHGGMGTVYEAIDERVNCLVALKTTRAASAREAELLANLRHPALPKVTDYFSDKDDYFLVMEYIPGDDFAKLLEIRGRPFPESDVLQWADKLLDLLGYLHSKQLLHRDIKPSNLKLTHEGELFLLDFGLAKGAVGQMPTLTSDKSVHGYTLLYSSREQILGQGTDVRSDIYSLGATLYHLLTGVLPIDANTRATLLRRQGRDPLSQIQNENSRVSPGVASIIHSAMEISRERRPASASEMRNALRGLPAGKSESPRRVASTPPPEPTERSPEPPPPAPYPHVPTIPVGPPPKVPQPYSTRIFSTENASPDGPPRAGIVKPMLLAVGVVLFLVGLSVALVVWQTGWLPWSDKNLYDETQGRDSANSSGATNSASPIASPSPAVAVNTKPNLTPTLINQKGIEFVLIRPGRFMMGSTSGDDRERPVHEVTINYSFYIGKYEVTQANWQQVMSEGPNYNRDCGGNCPALASWNSAQRFIQRLNAMNDGYTYRLPSEAEWEYACRAGTSRDSDDLMAMAWFAENSQNTIHAVGQKALNNWGLGDMHGNLSEWCEDWYHETYQGAPTDGSVRLSGGEQKYRVVRGGSFLDIAARLGSAFRVRSEPGSMYDTSGFRIVCLPQSQ